MTSSVKISVLVPIFNADKNGLLERALDSLLQQTLRASDDLEFICVNDGSTDDSPAVIRRYCQQDSRFKILDKPNGGYGQSLNRGMEIAQGEYIAILEPDDFLELDTFESLWQRVEQLKQQNIQVDVVKSAYWREMPDGNRAYNAYKGKIKNTSGVFKIQDDPEFLYNHPSVWTCLYRRGFLDGTTSEGRQIAPIRLHEIPGAGWADNPFFLETLCQAATISYVDKALYHYFEENPAGSSTRMSDAALPFDRWNDMMDIVDELHITDEGILDALYFRGFAYVLHVRDHCDLSVASMEEVYTAECKRMCQRMNKELVLKSGRIGKGDKLFYLNTMGLPQEKFPRGAYNKWLVGEFFHSLKVNGLGHALRRFKTFWKRFVLKKDPSA